MRYVEGETSQAASATPATAPYERAVRPMSARVRASKASGRARGAFRARRAGRSGRRASRPQARNIMNSTDGRADHSRLGLARDVRGASVTPLGRRLGTPSYIGARADRGSFDRRTDVWALGVTLFEAATGRRPSGRPASPCRARSSEAASRLRRATSIPPSRATSTSC